MTVKKRFGSKSAGQKPCNICQTRIRAACEPSELLRRIPPHGIIHKWIDINAPVIGRRSKLEPEIFTGRYGIRSRDGKNRTLSPREWSQRSEFTMFNTLVLAPNVVAGEVDVFPAER
jgi:hypothetical protein